MESRKWFLDKIYETLPIPKSKLGRCKKHHPYDCGNSKCFCCHSDKAEKRRFNKIDEYET